MYKYGFELEGFAMKNGQVTFPKSAWPKDGFPGLVEIRNTGGERLIDQYGKLLQEIFELNADIDFERYEHTFTGADMAYLRKNFKFNKRQVDILNIYGKNPRRSGNKTLAAFQINISNLVSHARESKVGQETIHYPARYGLLNINRIVKALDKEFKAEIEASNRQAGMYAIKDDVRLEYRSLPNSVFKQDIDGAHKLIKRIQKAVETEE